MGKQKKSKKKKIKQKKVTRKKSNFPKEPLFLDRNESQTGPVPEVYKFLKKVDLEHLSWYSRDFQKGIKSALSNV
jgi:hypothetical protein